MIERMRGQRRVLGIRHGSDLHYANRPGWEGLEVIGRNQIASGTKGLQIHLTIAVTRQGPALDRRFVGHPKLAGSLIRRTRLIAVIDRKAAFFEFFDEHRRSCSVEILVRAKHDFRLADEPGMRLATDSELARATDVSKQTIGRARKRLHGMKVPAVLARAARMLRVGCSLVKVAKTLAVSRSTLWRVEFHLIRWEGREFVPE